MQQFVWPACDRQLVRCTETLAPTGFQMDCTANASCCHSSAAIAVVVAAWSSTAVVVADAYAGAAFAFAFVGIVDKFDMTGAACPGEWWHTLNDLDATWSE